jgi:hypothetical protein
MRILTRVVVVLALGLAFAIPAGAVPIAVPNFSFESPAVADGFFSGVTPNWSLASFSGASPNAGAADPTAARYASAGGNDGPLPSPAQGGQALLIELVGSTPSSATVKTSAAVATTQTNTVYDLTVAIGNPLGAFALNPGTVGVRLLADGIAVANTSFDGATGIPDGTFLDVSLQFLSTVAGQDLTIELFQSKAGATGTSAHFDNVRLEATSVAPPPGSAVPEPSALALVALGGIGLVAITRRRP